MTRSSRASAVGMVSTTLPSRITVTRSEISSTSSSRWETYTMPTPCPRNVRSLANSSSRSEGVSAAVGSSRMNTRMSWLRPRAIRMSWAADNPSEPARARGSICSALTRASAAAASRYSASRSTMRSTPPPAGTGGRPRQEHVAGHVQLRDERQFLVDGGDAVALGVAAVLEADRHPVDRDRAGVGLVKAGEHLDKSALAGPVLADQGVDLARVHLEVDAAERCHAGERLGDPLSPQQRHLNLAHQLVSSGRARVRAALAVSAN